MPSMFQYLSSLTALPENDVKSIHKQFMSDLQQQPDKLAETPIKALLILVFLTNFIDWCKIDDSNSNSNSNTTTNRTKQYEFTKNVDEPMRQTLNLGSMEQFLSICADTTSLMETTGALFYNFRPFLQQHIPKFVATRLLDIDDVATSELKRALQQQQQQSRLNGSATGTTGQHQQSQIDVLGQVDKIYVSNFEFSLDDQFIEFCAPIFSNFVHSFITNSAFMLTYLRDMEEDLLLSGGEDFDFDLGNLSENAELERFYVAMFYLYSNREQLASEFWSDTNSTSYGFLQWASHCNSPLIISTFCLTLSSLATGSTNAIHTFNFLQITNAMSENNNNNNNNSNNNNTNSTNSNNKSLINKYSSVSWSTIYSSLDYYNSALSSKSTNENISNLNSTTSTTTLAFHLGNSEDHAIPELGEDSIIFICGFFQLISQIAKNSIRARNELLKSDNYQLLHILADFLQNQGTPLIGQTLIVLSSLVNDDFNDRKTIWNILDGWIFDDRLIGLGSMIGSGPGSGSGPSSHSHSRALVSVGKNGVKSGNSVAIQDTFNLKLKTFNEVHGFAYLISELMKPIQHQEQDQLSLSFDPLDTLYPIDLGSRYRKQGVWVYVEYLSKDAFVKLFNSEATPMERDSLVSVILQFWERCLLQLDPELVLNSAACKLKDLDNITINKSIIRYLQSNPGSAVLNFLYDPKIHDLLFNVASLGIDKLNELPANDMKSQIVTKTLQVLELLLQREKFFIDELLSILLLPDNPFHLPFNVGTSGYASFFEVLLIHLPFVAHVALYVGSSNLKLARVSLRLFNRIVSSSTFNGGVNVNSVVRGDGNASRKGNRSNQGGGSGMDSNYTSLLNKNRILTMLETVDESTRIRYAFINQFESRLLNDGSIEDSRNISLKLEILQLIDSNLFVGCSNATISHFLLGFNTKNSMMSFGSELDEGTINSSRSLLDSFITVLKDTLTYLSNSTNVPYPPTRICSLILQILLKLCKSNLTGHLMLPYLRNQSLCLFLLQTTSKVYGDMTFWDGYKFKPNFSIKNKFSTFGNHALTLVDFITIRNLLLQLMSIELHSVSLSGSMSLLQSYVACLTNIDDHLSGSPKILELLDVLEFMPRNMIEKADQLFSGFDFDYVLRKIKVKTEISTDADDNSTLNTDSFSNSFDMSVIDQLVKLFGTESKALGLLHSSENTEVNLLFTREKSNLKRILSNTIAFDTLHNASLQFLHSWVVLVQIIAVDGKLNYTERTNFILEVFQYVIPKTNDFIKCDGGDLTTSGCAEELISLCVSLFHIYENDRKSMFQTLKERETSAYLDSTRLFPVFTCCVMGIVSNQSTASIRSDLYVLANSYLQQCMVNKQVITDLMIYVRSVDHLFLGVVCNDSLVGDGPCRITSLLLLESLLKILMLLQDASSGNSSGNGNNESNFILDLMCKNNYLSQLIQKLKTTDEMFRQCLDDGSHASKNNNVKNNTTSQSNGGNSGITIHALLYELTTFKVTLCFLTRIAQTRFGSQQLLNNDIFGIIKDCRFLNVDADLGFDLNLQDSDEPNGISSQSPPQRFVKLSISLDTPLTLAFGVTGHQSKNAADSRGQIPEKLSYYEIFIPVFQLINAVVISLGPQNETSLGLASGLKQHFSGLITAVLKREIIIEEQLNRSGFISGPGEKKSSDAAEKLKMMKSGVDYGKLESIRELSQLFTLLDTLV
ncbi:unnamed protein product [Ambrosiozyma monospora]|uniref:Unnamed protein product n=1 Tax=Ambrosiozyma monospora TaxID=43982 RepID=A0A9W6YWI9_AMBMO|nr:unnamed protein product [Ambrosiozyma monospora]